MLAEFSDDPHRYADAKSRKNYAGTSPITRKSRKRAALSEARKIVRQACHILTELGDDALTAT